MNKQSAPKEHTRWLKDTQEYVAGIFKDTPLKPIIKKGVRYCEMCDHTLENRWGKLEKCSQCGQKLDWEKGNV